MMYVMFLTPLIFYKNFVYIIQFMYIVICVFLIFTNFNSFFSSVSYSLGLDWFSYGLIILSLLICSLMSISMVFNIYKSFYIFMNIYMLMCLMFIFMTTNYMYMYMFFEFVLFPLMILILGWGYQPERMISSLYLLFYTLIASLPFLVVIMNIYNIYGSLFFDYLKLMNVNMYMYMFMVFCFFIKMPMFMFHYWLPKAHVQAPVSGSMILAGLMLKIGGYGLIRVMNLFEFIYMKFSYLWYSLSIVGSVYICLLCMLQGDMKCLVAYSSVAHMGLCIMGLMTMTSWGLWGSFLLMLSHGFCSSGLFYMVNIFYCRSLSRSFYVNKGLLMYMPSCSLFWFLLCCFNMSCPPSLNFFSEFFILISMIKYWGFSVFYFMLISFFCACFSYYLYSFIHNGVYCNLYSFMSVSVLETLCIFMHLFPLVVLSLGLMILM
uniref:NADH-ubiquinone oxidoreductase chain 4 n=1 Tax=Chanohirata hamata TaxID=3032134 RepID=A0A7G8JRY4_9HEMI|nr:NADH dehydrogenase subunit 4 [Chanohirata hamata]QNJ33332.1 NADH dehydrogenase subunit 4 [Chanohirata hamata]